MLQLCNKLVYAMYFKCETTPFERPFLMSLKQSLKRTSLTDAIMMGMVDGHLCCDMSVTLLMLQVL